MSDVYLFGQVIATHSFLLSGGFLKPDEYSEIDEHYFLPGGETGTAATVLDSLGVSSTLAGTWQGPEAHKLMRDFYGSKKVDLSVLEFREDFPAVMHYVIITDDVRTPMGRFQHLAQSGKRWWNIPDEKDIIGCRAAAVDPYFGAESEKAARICLENGIPYVTIDCRHDSFLHRHAAVDVISGECASQLYPGMEPEKIMELMQETSEGLTIITQGKGEMLFARKGEKIKRMKPFSVRVKSTLGAGDTYKAGCVYGVLKGFSDEELVRFASACSGVAVSRFPLPLDPPKLGEVEELIASQTE